MNIITNYSQFFKYSPLVCSLVLCQCTERYSDFTSLSLKAVQYRSEAARIVKQCNDGEILHSQAAMELNKISNKLRQINEKMRVIEVTKKDVLEFKNLQNQPKEIDIDFIDAFNWQIAALEIIANTKISVGFNVYIKSDFTRFVDLKTAINYFNSSDSDFINILAIRILTAK